MANLQCENDLTTADVSSDPDPTDAERALRLRDAVRAAGGNKAVAARVPMPVSTLNRYIAGRDMKASALVSLAQATGVRLEWLATGEGPMRPAEAGGDTGQPSRQQLGTPAAAPREPLFSQINADRLADAYVAALQALAARGHTNPEPRRVMQVTILLYDELTEAEEDAPTPAEKAAGPVTKRTAGADG